MSEHWYDNVVPELVDRALMPQIDPGDVPALIHFAVMRGVEVRLDHFLPGKLLVHQAVDGGRVAAVAGNALFLNTPCLVSEEPYILDGNHRAAAHNQLGTPIPAFRFALPFAAAIKLMFHFPRSYTIDAGHKKEAA